MPYVQLSRIRRPPWVRDGEALIGPGMENSRLWKEIIGELRDPFPARLILLTATPECTQPEAFYLGPEFSSARRACIGSSCPPSPTTTQHSLPGGPLRPYLGRTFTGWIAPAWPGARASLTKSSYSS